MNEGGAALSLTYIASEKVIPGYGGKEKQAVSTVFFFKTIVLIKSNSLSNSFFFVLLSGGMSSAKAQLESDTRTLAYEAGRKHGLRVNTISAGPLKSRAASAIGTGGKKTFIEYAIDYSKANSPMAQDLYSEDVGNAGLFLCSNMARAVTGTTMYVDNGLNCMGMALDEKSMEESGGD